MRVGFSILILCLGLQPGVSQPHLSVDNTEIRIGEQIHVTVTMDLSEGGSWVNADQFWPDTISQFEIAGGPAWRNEDRRMTSATWKVSFFDTGWIRIPALPVIIKDQQRTDTFYTLDIPVKVIPVEPDTSGLHDIRDIYRQPFSLSYYRRYLPHLMAFLLVMTAAYLWLNRRRKKAESPPVLPRELLPHEWAMKELSDLALKKLWQQGEIKEHYSALTAILRGYLERRFDIHAMEQTTEEILAQLRLQHLDPELVKDTESLLPMADMIKFAKADPGRDIHADTIERVRSFVRATTPDTGSEVISDKLEKDPDEAVE